MSTCREVIAVEISGSAVLASLGLPTGAVYQADTLDSPTEFPFIVLRWTEELEGVGDVTRRPFEVWCYDEQGDYTRAERIGHAALALLDGLLPTTTDDGMVMAVRTRGPGLGRGRDLFDDGYKAVVIPFRAQAIARGV